MNYYLINSALVLVVLFFYSTTHAQKVVDLIIKNATIYTIDSSFSKAKNLVVHNGKFVDVGNDELLIKYQSNNNIDATGKFIYPGFMDAHCHFTGYSLDQYKLNLFGTTSFQGVVDKIINYAQNNKRQWIEGRLWDEHLWKQQSFPTKDTLDILFPNTPIFLMRIDGHAVLCNQKALDLAGINSNTKITNGAIEIKNSRLTGIIVDKAIDAVKNIIPALDEQEAIPYFQKTEQLCFQLGLTSLVDCGLTNTEVHWLGNAYENHEISIRNAVMLIDEVENYNEYLKAKPLRTNNFHIIGFKIFADGSLGSRGAFLLKNYKDQKHQHGYLLTPIDSINAKAKKIIKSNYQLNIHAIGDRANREVLKIYATVLPKNNDRRWRVEHAQMINKNDFHYFHDYKIIPSVQPTHATSDMNWVKSRIGKRRMKTAYAYKTLVKQNNWLPLGTDFPVESFNPLHTFFAAVFRTDNDLNPIGGFQIENGLTREEALKGITIWAAKSVFEEDVKGSIEKGKFADFVILNINLLTASPLEIQHAKVQSTYLSGKLVYTIKN